MLGLGTVKVDHRMQYYDVIVNEIEYSSSWSLTYLWVPFSVRYC